MQTSLPLLTHRDRRAIEDITKQFDIDYVALTYTCNAEDVLNLRGFLQSLGKSYIKVIAKVVTSQYFALSHLKKCSWNWLLTLSFIFDSHWVNFPSSWVLQALHLWQTKVCPSLSGYFCQLADIYFLCQPPWRAQKLVCQALHYYFSNCTCMSRMKRVRKKHLWNCNTCVPHSYINYLMQCSCTDENELFVCDTSHRRSRTYHCPWEAWNQVQGQI